MTRYQIDPGQPGLTFQICDPCYETMITPNNANQNKYEAQLPINSLLNDKIRKNSI